MQDKVLQQENALQQHLTVLRDEAVAALISDKSGWYVDGTFGRGGHTRHLLSQLDAAAHVMGIDKDPRAIEAACGLAADDPRFVIAQGSFAELEAHLQTFQWSEPLTGVLLDLGVSSPQLDDAERGFSFLRDGDLDMRMDTGSGQSAAQWLAVADEQDIAVVLKEFGEERFAKRIARAIVEARSEQPITRTLQLAKIVSDANPAWEKHKHPATRSFQAIRIYINQELSDLEVLLERVIDQLAVGGRLVVISFHSLEDRIVKRFMRRQAQGEKLPANLPVTDASLNRRLKIIGKALKPSVAEVDANPRARSAVMRVAEKLA
ncbi:16S rRNA (cytosine(1402)-N(4))-methyltransferase RsmH [Spongiibacter pelagi]|uniref:16S rRNA (cytosine(1402)-N(4))-methyltransferase RsmH n=1 Tax=Spongiibacter pelagi TaxID=2760804 RepID=UPI0037DA0D5E